MDNQNINQVQQNIEVNPKAELPNVSNANHNKLKTRNILTILLSFILGLFISGGLAIAAISVNGSQNNSIHVVVLIFILTSWVGPVVTCLLLKSHNIKHRLLVSILEEITVLVIEIGLLVMFIFAIAGAFQQASQKPNTSKVQAIYIQTADKYSKIITSHTNSPNLFSTQTLSTDKSSGKTNEVNQLYCFSAVNNQDIVSEISKGYTGSWSYTGQADGTVPSIISLQPLYQQTGNVDLQYETGTSTLATSDQSIYPAGYSDVTLSKPDVSNTCSKIANQKNINTSNQAIISLQLDLFDSSSSSTVTIWQAPTNSPEEQALNTELDKLNLTSIDNKIYSKFTPQEDATSPEGFGFGTIYNRGGANIDTCFAGTEKPSMALVEIDKSFTSNGWTTYYQGDDTIPYAVNALDTNQNLDGLSFLYTKANSLGQISANLTLEPNNTGTCVMGSNTHVFDIGLSFEK